MKTTCDLVAERVALGEPLDGQDLRPAGSASEGRRGSIDDLAEHTATCARCRRLVALPSELGVVHRESDPGVGFSSRITVGAQKRLVVRHRRRVAVAVSGVVATGAIAVLVFMRTPEVPAVAVAPATATEHTSTPTPIAEPVAQPVEPTADDAALGSLVHLARADRHASARWGRITKPLAPYRKLVKGVAP